MMPYRFVVPLLAVALAGACQLPGATSSCNMMIDWVNFIQVGTTQFVAGPDAEASLSESELGPVYTHVKFKVSGNVCDSDYRPKDGDAAFLDPGTPIYQVSGHPPAEELAARFNSRILVYRPIGGAS
jgi:hypothetical protein